MRKIIVEKGYNISLVEKGQMMVICPLLNQNLYFEIGLDDSDNITIRHRDTYLLDDLMLAYNLMLKHREGIVLGIKSYETR